MTRTRTAFVALLALLLTACSGTPTSAPDAKAPTTSATPTAAPEPTPPKPRLGACRRLTWHQAVESSSTQPTVPCRQRHTALTYAVGQLPYGPQDPDQVDQLAVICPKRMARYFRLDPRRLRLLTLKPSWFVPSSSDAERGATWFRCDAIVVAGHQQLQPLPANLRQSLTQGPAQTQLAMCATAAPGRPGFARVPCVRPHSWRALTSVDLPGAKYPTGPGVLAEQCRSAAKAAAADPLDFSWSQELPTREQWAAGQRYGLCWVPD